MIIYDCKYVFMISGPHERHTGKPAEGGQHAKITGEIKTGEAQRLFGSSLNSYSGMNMTRKKIMITAYGRVIHVVNKPETIHFQFIGCNMNVTLAVPVIVQNIVVTFYEMNLQIREMVRPVCLNTNRGYLLSVCTARIIIPFIKKKVTSISD